MELPPEKWNRVKEIFHEAFEMPDGERAQFVSRECSQDSIMLAEVKSLLDSYSESKSLFEAPALAAVADLIEDRLPSSAGQIIGSYKLESEIGRGGMGAVYLASRADDAYDKKVAIKLIKRGLDTDEIVRRFRYERQILAGLEHPNITRLIDGGSTEDGLPYLVMDYVAGVPLTGFADEQKLTVRQRLDLFLQICSAVSYAHQSLVIHRDLKPSNILVTGDGVPKLLDFGIAKITAPGADGDQTIDRTVAAFHALTPEYASPEQLAGQPVTTASDIYSLGVILYELLTGSRPYSFKSRTAVEVGRVLAESPITKPSTSCRMRSCTRESGDGRSCIRALEGDLDNIVLMAIRMEPARRYSSVEQFAADIRRHLDGMPVIARHDTVGYRASKFVMRNKGGVVAGVGIAASLIGGLIAASRQARIAARQRDLARSEASKAEKVSRYLQKMLSSADPRVVGRDSRVIDILRMAADSVETEFARQPEIAADLNTTIGLTYLGLGELCAAEKYLKAALDTRLELFPRRSVKVATSLQNYGKLLSTRGDLKRAEPLFCEALDILENAEGGDETDLANVLDDLGYLRAFCGDGDSAINLHVKELDIRRRTRGQDHPDVARTMGKIATVYAVMGSDAFAEPLLRDSLRILLAAYGPEHPDVAWTKINLVRCILKSEPDEAERLSREVNETRLRLLGPEHPETAWSLYNLSFVLLTRGKLAEAEDVARTILGMRGPNLPDEHPAVASAYLVLGRVLCAKGSVSHALKAYEVSLELRQMTLPVDHWLLASTRSFMGECLVKSGDVATGRRLLRESFEAIRAKLGDDHEQTKQSFERLKSSDAVTTA
ncbi:MAG: hypothetical protein DMF63_16255 [Acidobacteria bacterium]|nr:MAG: hypothetical protein DMF63_16255 [Acidobacteriota bacterium]